MLNNIMSTCHICQNVKSSNTACRGGGSLGTWMWRGNRLALGPRGGAMSKRGVPWAFLILTAPELSAFDWCVIWHPTATWSEYLDMQASHLVVSEFWTIWLIFLNRCCSYIKGGGVEWLATCCLFVPYCVLAAILACFEQAHPSM